MRVVLPMVVGNEHTEDAINGPAVVSAGVQCVQAVGGRGKIKTYCVSVRSILAMPPG